MRSCNSDAHQIFFGYFFEEKNVEVMRFWFIYMKIRKDFSVAEMKVYV